MATPKRPPRAEAEPSGRDMASPEARPPVPEAASTDGPPVPPPALGKTYRSSEAGGALAGTIPGGHGPVFAGPRPIPGGPVPTIHQAPAGNPAPGAFGHGWSVPAGRPAAGFPAPFARPATGLPTQGLHPTPMSPAPAPRPPANLTVPAPARHPGDITPPFAEPAGHHPPHTPPEPRTER